MEDSHEPRQSPIVSTGRRPVARFDDLPIVNAGGTTNPPVAVVTGGARGLGRAIAQCLVRDGHAVVVADIDEQEASVTAEAIADPGSTSVVAVAHDVRDPQSSEDLIRSVTDRFGRLDVLVNNAGVGPRPGPFHTLTEDEYDRVMTINAKGVFLVSKAAIPLMIKQRAGSVINISSVVAKRASPNILPYAASKWAVIGMTQTMARELAQYDITVNAVCPGVIRTQLHEGVVAGMSNMTKRTEDAVWGTFLDRILFDRLQEPQDIAEMVAFLASSKARNITGSAFNVNGGMEFN